MCALVALLLCATGSAWADKKTEGFEGKTAGSDYQSTITISTSESDCGIGWQIYYGTVSTSSKISGSNSAALRLYTSNNYGYIKTTTPIEGLSNVAFKAKAATSNGATIKVNVDYSIDGSSWTTIATNQVFASSATSYNYDIPSGGKYFRLIITSSSTKPSKSNAQLTVDDVVFTYTPPVSTYSVTYDANGATSGTVPTDATSYSSGATVTVKGNTGSLAKTGYTFGGWNTKADGSGTTYAAAATFSISTNTTLYAKWNVNQYNVALASVDDVTLSASYGTSSSLAEGENANINYGTELTLSATGLASGYMFTWKVTDDGDNDVTSDVLDGSTLTVPAYDITISGTVAEIPLYTVTFNAGTGSCATASLKEEEQEAGVTLPTATIGVSGWSFAGWATTSTTNTEEEPTLYDAGSTYHPTDNITLYAVYKFGYKSSTIFTRATSVSDITSADKIVIAYNDGEVLNTSINLSTNLSETDSKVTPNANAIFTLSGDNTNGYTLTNGTNTIGTSGSGASLNIALSSTNNLWTFSSSTYTTNVFHVNNVNASGKSLEVYNSAWKAYALTANRQAWSMRIYVPATDYVYNSTPAAIVNPTIAFTTAGDKSLYVKDDDPYDNAANVTGIAKTATYTSSDETVATVTPAGVVTALKAGSATITATVAAEAGVNTEASTTYEVTVKDAKTIAGLKAITSTATVVSFTADLTDAVVTYVKGNHAFIQDASGAVYASCGSSLTAGDKINGAVTGSIKAANAIDEITAITLTAATVTEDGVIPSAEVKTAAQLVANKVDLEGKLVQITGATVTASLTNGSASGGKISDDGKTTEINLYAPDSNIEALKDAEGTFNGYISLYNGSTIRFNIYEQSQISLTKNAPTDQPLTFASYAVELDEDTDDVEDFTGQVVSGAKGTVTYSIDSDASSVVSSIVASTGVVTLSGNCGTATIKASAAAANVTEDGVTTPYNATTKTYTITVYPRYTVTFSVNDAEVERRQATHGAAITVPSPSDNSGFEFMGWSTSTVALTNVAPSMETLGATITPENDVTYYAVFASATVTPDVEYTSTFTIKQSSAPSSPYVNNGSSWTWSNVTFQNDNNACIDKTSGSITFTLPAGGKAVSLNITKTGNAWAGAAAVVLKDASSNTVNTYTGSSVSFDFTEGTYDESSSYTLTNTTGSNAWVDHITFVYTADGVSYKNYCTTVPAHVNIASTAGYTTYVATDNVSFPVGATAYIATAVNPSTIHLDEVVAVPEGTAVVVKGDKGVYLLDVEDAGDCDDVSGNLLLASTGITSTGTQWALAKLDGVVGFYKVKSGVEIPEGKAYLNIDGGGSVKEFLTFDFDTDAISDVRSKMDDVRGDIFNLAGQKMNRLQKGINIINGKKIYVK